MLTISERIQSLDQFAQRKLCNLQRHQSLLMSFLLLTILAAYLPAILGEFAWDDNFLIVQEENIHHLSLESLKLFFSKSFLPYESAYYRPMVTLSYALDWHFSGGNPYYFHLINVLIHAFNCILLFYIVRKFNIALFSAFTAASFFGLFPRLTHSVAWISGRTDIFAAFFILLAISVYPTASPNYSLIQERRRIQIIHSILSAFFFIFCLPQQRKCSCRFYCLIFL